MDAKNACVRLTRNTVIDSDRLLVMPHNNDRSELGRFEQRVRDRGLATYRTGASLDFKNFKAPFFFITYVISDTEQSIEYVALAQLDLSGPRNSSRELYTFNEIPGILEEVPEPEFRSYLGIVAIAQLKGWSAHDLRSYATSEPFRIGRGVGILRPVYAKLNEGFLTAASAVLGLSPE